MHLTWHTIIHRNPQGGASPQFGHRPPTTSGRRPPWGGGGVAWGFLGGAIWGGVQERGSLGGGLGGYMPPRPSVG